MDPVLAARLARQQQKEQTGESSVEQVGAVKTAASPIDPVLAQRLARQQEKADAAELSPDVTSPEEKKHAMTSPQIDPVVLAKRLPQDMASPQMDPVLAKRLARQREKSITGESAVAGIDLNKKVVTQLDPVLAKRLARQQEKVVTGESAVEQVSSKASKSTLLDPLLEKRMARQLEKNHTGENSVENAASPCRARREGGSSRGVVDSVLAERLAQQRAKTEDPKDKDQDEDTPSMSGSPDSKGSRERDCRAGEDSGIFDLKDFDEDADADTADFPGEGDGTSVRRLGRGRIGICAGFAAVIAVAVGLVCPMPR